MKVSLCTITFRHHLLSIEDIANWARCNGFQGIELWGAHALGSASTLGIVIEFAGGLVFLLMLIAGSRK